MPTLTPKMQSSVPCDGKWHRIYTCDGIIAHVFIQFTGATCTLTARLIEDPPAPAPGAPAPAAPAKPVVKKEMLIPKAGGWRGLNAWFEHFEVRCAPPAGGQKPKKEKQPPEQQQQLPDVEAAKRGDPKPAPAIQDCPFEWYMVV